MKKHLLLKTLLPVLLLAIVTSHNGCSSSRGTKIEGTSTTGNPMTTLKVAPYTFANGQSGNGLVFCTNKIILAPTDIHAPPVEVSFSNPAELPVPQAGTSLGSLFIPSGNYSQATLELSDVCGSGKSLGLTNGNGTFQTARTVPLGFAGQATVGVSSTITFDLQAIVDELETVNSDSQVVASATANSGGFHSNAWQTMTINGAPPASQWVRSVWTGREMIVWGGCNTSATEAAYEQCGGASVNTGGRYNPITDTWTATSTVNAPSPRHGFAIAWTGSKLIVWGGHNDGAPFRNGGLYDPSTDTWKAISTVNAPTTGMEPAFAWTGTELIVWGGDPVSPAPAGGRYNPSTDTWAPMTTTNAPAARMYSVSTWTGSEMLVWGGVGPGYLNTGGRYNPSLDRWLPINSSGAPSGRSQMRTVWTGQEMIIWGGVDPSVRNDGARYNPATDTWTAMTLTNAPSARHSYSEIWSGQEVMIWGGSKDDGGRYDPSTDSWLPMSANDAPSARFGNGSVWTGSEMIIWGGKPDAALPPLNTGGRYSP